MEKKILERIEKVQRSVDQWLSPDNYTLKEAIDKTVNDGHFSFQDVKYQIQTLKKKLNKEELSYWAEQAGLKSTQNQKTVMCLHAGNLPLVGVQDILAIALSGHRYLGKLSRKDSYLPQTLLEILRKENLIDGVWSVELDDLKGNRSDAVMFSGSTSTAGPVIARLNELGIATDETPRLLRTAHFSIALIEDNQPDTMHNLANAVFRYGGKGCRSVAVVVAPFSLGSSKCSFTDYVELFWLKQPQHEKAPPALYHRYAYNKAAGKEQAWLDDFLIEETEMEPVDSFIVHWVKGERYKAAELANRYKSSLQSVYVTNLSVDVPNLPVSPELLSDAQQPPVWWKPDGVDPLKWLGDL